MPDEQAEPTQSIKTPARNDLKAHKNEQPSLTDWQETAAKYAGREIDWDKINQYAPKDATRQTHNHQYDYDYLLPGIERDGGVSR